VKKILKSVTYVLALVFFSVALSGCSLTSNKKPAPTVAQTPVVNQNEIVVWGFEDEDVWKPIKGAFDASAGGLLLRYEKHTLDDEYENKVLNSITAGQGPDAWAMPSDWVYRHKDKLAPPPVDPKTKTNGIDLKEMYAPSIAQSVQFNNYIYALPVSAEPLIVYYNPKIFEKTLNDFFELHSLPEEENLRNKTAELLYAPPATWGNFVEAVKLLTKKNGKEITTAGVAMGTSSIASAQDILYLLMLQNNTRIISEDLKLATFNLAKDNIVDPSNIPGKRALDFYTSFSNPNSVNYSWNDAIGSSLDAFANGKVAMIFGYPSLQQKFLQSYPNFQYRKAFVPQLGQEQYQVTDYVKFTAFGVSRLSKNIPAAWALVKQISFDPSYIAQADQTPGAGKIVGATRDYVNNPEPAEIMDGQSLVKGRFPGEFDENIKSAITAVNNGSRDSKSALDIAAVNVTDLLKKTGW